MHRLFVYGHNFLFRTFLVWYQFQIFLIMIFNFQLVSLLVVVVVVRAFILAFCCRNLLTASNECKLLGSNGSKHFVHFVQATRLYANQST